MQGATVHRFVCNHNHTAVQTFFHPSGSRMRFERGVLDTDEAGAKVIRANPLFKVTIFEGDPSTPAHTELAPESLPKRPSGASISVPESWYCSQCDRVFPKEREYRSHMARHEREERAARAAAEHQSQQPPVEGG